METLYIASAIVLQLGLGTLFLPPVLANIGKYRTISDLITLAEYKRSHFFAYSVGGIVLMLNMLIFLALLFQRGLVSDYWLVAFTILGMLAGALFYSFAWARLDNFEKLHNFLAGIFIIFLNISLPGIAILYFAEISLILTGAVLISFAFANAVLLFAIATSPHPEPNANIFQKFQDFTDNGVSYYPSLAFILAAYVFSLAAILSELYWYSDKII